jgi:pyruvate formate lyase activating enzyme
MKANNQSGVTEKHLGRLINMKIKGIQKVTLLDYPERIACTLFLFGCNFRCGFCHNPELVLREDSKDLDEKEILKFLEKRREKLEGVCITGGEPLLSLKKEFLKKIKKLGYLIKIDTNGCFPEKLKKFIEDKLVDYIAMDVKNCKEKYSKTVGVDVDLKKIEKSMKLIVASGIDYEFRTTVVPEIHKPEDIVEIGKWINALVGYVPERYCLQGFRNAGKFIDKRYLDEKNTKSSFLEELKIECNNFFKVVEIRV